MARQGCGARTRLGPMLRHALTLTGELRQMLGRRSDAHVDAVTFRNDGDCGRAKLDGVASVMN